MISDRRRGAQENVDVAFRLPGGAADEEAVDVWLADQFGGIAGIDAAAIKNRRH